MVSVVHFIRGFVAKLLLWPMDVVDSWYEGPECLDAADVVFPLKDKICLSVFMFAWYSFVVWGVILY